MEQNSNETPETPVENSAESNSAEETSTEAKAPRKRATRRVTTPAGAATDAQTSAEAELTKQSATAEPTAADSEPEKAPKRRATRSRKKTDAEAPASAADSQEAPKADDKPAEEPAQEAKKSRTTRKSASAENAQTDSAQTDAAQKEAAADASGVDTGSSNETEKKPATRRTRKKVAAADPQSENAADEEAPKNTTRTRRAKAEAAGDEPQEDASAESSDRKGRSRSRKSVKSDESADAKSTDTSGEKAADQPETDDKAQGQPAESPEEGANKGSQRGRRGRSNRSQDSSQEQSQSEAKSSDSDKSGDDKSGEDKSDTQDDSNNKNHRKDRGSSRSRTRQRDRKRRGNNDDGEVELAEDDVLLPIAGILDVLDNYAFVRTTGYLPGDSDVYVSLSQVKRYSLRKGDAIVGAIRQPREGEHSGRQKYNAIVKVDSVNGQNPEDTGKREDFETLTAVRPAQHVTLAGTGASPVIRGIDLFAPVALGQRGLIINDQLAAPQSTHVAAQMADALTEKLPDAHVMMLLVGSRPEDVTELTRSVNGEVIAASSDAAPEDQVTIVELAFERAKRLVELGHDVIVLVDSLDAIASALNLVTPPQHRNPFGGSSDSAITNTLQRLLSAARNVENGGSLTIYAAATEMLFMGESTVHAITNWELKLRDNGSRRSTDVTFDILESFALNSDAYLSPTAIAGTDALRAALVDAQSGEAAKAWLESNPTRTVFSLLGDTQDSDQFLVKLAQELA